MAFPTDWPPRPAEGRRSIRFYAEGTTTDDFEDTAFLFKAGVGANTYVPLPVVAPGSTAPVEIGNRSAGFTPAGTGANDADDPTAMLTAQTIMISYDVPAVPTGELLEYSFDGVNVHGVLHEGEHLYYRDRYEAGIAVRGVPIAPDTGVVPYRIEAW